ncbi:MAG: leucine--tRNA ligase [Candidatus Komeilibacteria bacterium]
MEKYNHREIESSWQEYWEKQKLNQVPVGDHSRPKKYILDMFPYPSAQGLHVGHPEGYTATDIYSRYLRYQKFNVLHPMGWDAFGLPAENYAIKTGTQPAVVTTKNIENFKRQIMSLGLSYDWSREVNTTDPKYFQWTQWIFLQLFKKGLAYEAVVPINWCPSCKTGLANEEVVAGKCDRCGQVVVKQDMKQWMLKITAYADRLLNGLDELDWPESIKSLQKNWIGRSEGAEVDFSIADSAEKLTVFTTRPDTLFGATYMVVAPEHEIINKLKNKISNWDKVQDYIKQAKNKSDLERTDLAKEKSGVELKGIQAINPVNNKEIPIWVADYVLASYGTGAIMAVPAHDERDYEFASKFRLDIIQVVDGGKEKLFIGDGIAMNSGEYNGLSTAEFKKKIIQWLEKHKAGRAAVNYKLRDWVFSRQRYWGEPIPLIHCAKCGIVPVDEKDLPLELPEVDKYEPTGTGESPLAGIMDWVNTKCPQCGGAAKRETNTMPQWAGSSWYWLRFTDPNNEKVFADQAELKYWLPVDVYVGGAEHAVLHLLYARFWNMVLFDLGFVPIEEPFKKLINQGLILGPDGEKMSKSRGNVINPDSVVEEYGADTLRLYEMFMGPLEDSKPWDTKSIVGVRRFLDKVYRLSDKIGNADKDNILLHKTIKKVGEDIVGFRFNTAISAMMIFINEAKIISKNDWEKFLIILSPFAPHLAEELWHRLGYQDSIFLSDWPQYDKKLAQDDKFELVVQVNGKVRDKVLVKTGISQIEVEKLIQKSDKVQKYLDGATVKKIIYVPNKLVNIVF